ncbi:hypothetical protein [Mycobacterium sp. E2462]|uniref:hypothetical protein n=1 Tax=Mycobacterium sp. E2462 TaxID=1834133 RepID=UPI0012E9D881|nr:hypothetical protein [Mycobacterium sp. E2462]
MTISTRALRGAAASAMGAGAVAGALLFGGAPAAQAAPAPTTGIAVAGPHGGPGHRDPSHHDPSHHGRRPNRAGRE